MNKKVRMLVTKYLRLTVDDKLIWTEQYKSVKGKVAGGLASLREPRSILPQSQLLNVYLALVESYLRYANVVWGPSPILSLALCKDIRIEPSI